MGKDVGLWSTTKGVFDYLVEVSADGLEAYLTVRLRPEGHTGNTDALPLPSPDDIVSVLAEHDVRHGLQMDVIRSLSAGQLKGRQRVARGTPPRPGKDGRVELLFLDEKPMVPTGHSGRIDYFERGEVVRVQAGTVIARLHSPSEGQSGRTVTGEAIKAPPSKQERIQIREGALLDVDDGTIVATRDGRPDYTDGTIRVVDVLEIEGNVDLKLGNVRYQGGVVVHGDVEENLRVEARGAVIVRRNVAQARVLSQTGIRVDGHVVGSRLGVSAMTDMAMHMAQVAEDTLKQFTGLCALADELWRRFPRSQREKIPPGYFVTMLASKKFPELFGLVEELRTLLKDGSLSAIDEQNTASKIVDGLVKNRVKRLRTLDDLVDAVTTLGDITKRLRKGAEDKGHFIGRYAQVSTIVVSGSAYFQGRGAYHTKVEAGRFVVVNGVFRGGEAKAGNGVYIREVGSPIEVETVIRIDEGGFLQASLIHPGVYVHIGDRVWKASTTWQNIEIRVSKSGTIEALPFRSWVPPAPPRSL